MKLSPNHITRPAAPLDELKATERGRTGSSSAQVWLGVFIFTLQGCSMTTNVLVTKDVVTVNAHAEITEKILDLLWFL